MGGAGKWGFFESAILIFFSQWKQAARSYEVSFIFALSYGGFLQNLGKDCIQTNIHMTVCYVRNQDVGNCNWLKFFFGFVRLLDTQILKAEWGIIQHIMNKFIDDFIQFVKPNIFKQPLQQCLNMTNFSIRR